MSSSPLISDQTDPTLPGSLFAGKYRVEKILGQGGMGMVLAARHLGLDEPVAIKVLLPAMMQVPGMVERFTREARASAKIKNDQSSSPGGLHPRALTEPDVKLSPHPAPTIQPRAARRAATGRTSSDPVARCYPASASTHALDVAAA